MAESLDFLILERADCQVSVFRILVKEPSNSESVPARSISSEPTLMKIRPIGPETSSVILVPAKGDI